MSQQFNELQTRNEQDLLRDLSERREALRRARFDLSAGRVKNIRSIRVMRRDIARILTALKQRARVREV